MFPSSNPREETPYEGGMFHFVLYVTLVAAAMETHRARFNLCKLTKKTIAAEMKLEDPVATRSNIRKRMRILIIMIALKAN